MNIDDIEAFAKENNVPIMEKDGIDFLVNYIKENNLKKILEIGTAIGYSAIKIALIDKDISVTSVERDQKRYEIALKNIDYFNLNNQVELILEDALEVVLKEEYDLIFVDAAKSQYINFFNKFKENLKSNGIIISDNLNFHGLTKTTKKIESRNVRGIVRKLNNYVEFLKNNNEFETKFIDIGDGISISIKK